VEVHIDAATRHSLVRETRWVMFAFLLPALTGAIVPLVQHSEGVTDINRFPTVVPGQPLTNMVLGILLYTSVGAVVPLSLFLLSRTGQSASELGLGVPSWSADIWPGFCLAVLSFASEIVVLIPFAPLLIHQSSLVVRPAIGHVPPYYVVYAIALSAITAITEEVVVNGYLLTRLEQLGWTPRSALVLSVVLRTSYHAYYGIAFFLVIPFGYFVTRSFQKHRRINRPIAAHFLYDAVLTTISVLVH
jgi:membrane protease YdiL (CAAX protease family)